LISSDLKQNAIKANQLYSLEVEAHLQVGQAYVESGMNLVVVQDSSEVPLLSVAVLYYHSHIQHRTA